MELNRLLAGDQHTSYVRHVGDPAVLRAIRFVITLDADTELPRDSARRLVATLAHPLNRAVFDVATGRVTAGYTILQPRIEGTSISAEVSRFSALVAGDSGLDPYTRAVSDLYQDLFGEGMYFGKGIYDPEAFERSLRGRVPENAILSHDLFEGLHGRTGFVADVALFEEFSANYLTYSRRLHRWARGDWQLLPWLRRRVPLEGGGKGASCFSLISRWKILDNMRGSLFEPSLFAFLLLAWGWLPGSTSLWTLLVLLVPAAPAFSGALLASLRRALPAFVPRRSAIGRWMVQIVFLPHRAAVLCDALLRTLYRLAVSRKTSSRMDNRRIERAPTRRQNCEPLDVVRNGGAAADGAGCGRYVGGVSTRGVGARISTPARLVPLAGNCAVHEPAAPAARGATDAAGHAALPPPGAAHLAVLRDLRRA